MLKAAILILVTIIVTYYAKFHTYTVEPVREHQNLGWILPLPGGLSFLFVAADDNIDTNFTKTGHRIWFNPPKQPNMLFKGEKAPFAGPALTIIKDSLDLETIAQLSASLTDGGVLHIIGTQQLPLEIIKKQNPRVLITQEEIRNSTISLPMGKDISNSITFDSLGSYTALIHNTQYYYSIAFGAAITPATQHIPPPTVHINLSVRTHAEEALSREYFPAAHTIVYRDLIDTLSQDSTHLNIHESDKGVVFYEDKNLGEDRLLIKKINLASWRAESQ